jgi:HK97 family phage prohead protease
MAVRMTFPDVSEFDAILKAQAIALPAKYSHSAPVKWQAEVKSVGKQGIITSWLTQYNNPDGTPFIDGYNDFVEPGSFTKTIRELNQRRRTIDNPYLCPDLWQHDRSEQIGGITNLTEDSKGVIYEAQLLLSIQRAKEAFDLAEAKMIGSSYGYNPILYEPKNGIRHLQEIELREVSQVSFPANYLATVIGTKTGFPPTYAKSFPPFPPMPQFSVSTPGSPTMGSVDSAQMVEWVCQAAKASGGEVNIENFLADVRRKLRPY